MWKLFRKASYTESTLDSSLVALQESASYIETQLETRNSGFAAVILKPSNIQDKGIGIDQIQEIIRSQKTASNLITKVQEDEWGVFWIFIEGPDLAINSANISLIIKTLESNDLYDQFIGVIFPFDWFDSIRGKSIRLFWILQSRINRFTPFVPTGNPEDKLRDQPIEARMEKAMRNHIPTEKKISEWYPIWNMPDHK